MPRKFPATFAFLTLMISIFLASCARLSGPVQIAAMPLITPIAVYPPKPEASNQVFIEMSVADVDIATARAAQLAGNFGGYVQHSSSWFSGIDKYVRLEIEVPDYNREGLQAALLGLGKLLRVSTAVEKPYFSYEERRPYTSHFTLTILPEGTIVVPPQTKSWRPLITLRRAFDVFLNIFGFLVDILIWIFVVGGPFILIALAVWWLVRRRLRSITNRSE